MKDPKSIRIVFMGTPGFAVGVLQKLVEEQYNVVAVITAPDKPAGRGQQFRQSEVKQYAVSKNLRVLQPEKLKSPEFLEELKACNADLQIVVAFRMLPEAVWQMPPMGTFNLHASLLPQYRGAAPINRAIMNGETKTGVTTFFLQQQIDTGNILFREEVRIGENENAGELHDKLMIVGAGLVTKTVDAIGDGTCKPVSQEQFVAPGEVLHDAPKIFRDDCRIDWKKTGQQIHDHVRGLSPYPGAWTTLNFPGDTQPPVEIKVFRTVFVPGTSAEKDFKPGFQRVQVEGGYIEIKEVQLPGKRRMPVEDLLRGNPLEGAYVL